MNQISAAGNLIIDIQANRWRLIASNDSRQEVLMEAVAGSAIRYVPLFASKRKLPESGTLYPDHIKRVLVGWSEKDASWHLGLVLESDLARQRGSRWCELAAWPDQSAAEYRALAEHAGQSLSATIARPFSVVPPDDNNHRVVVPPPVPTPTDTTAPSPFVDESLPPYHDQSQAAASSSYTQQGGYTELSSHAASPQHGLAQTYDVPASPGMPQTPYTPPYDVSVYATESVSLPGLPVQIEMWSLQGDEHTHLELVRSRKWSRNKVLRVMWYSFWVAIYVILVIATLVSDIADPSPEFLPYLGIVTATIVIGLVLHNLYELITRPNRIVIERATGTLRVLRGKREQWRATRADIEAVYVTQVVNRRTVVQHGELNLQLAHSSNGEFYSLLVQEQPKGKPTDSDTSTQRESVEDEVRDLNQSGFYTDLQVIGGYIARVLDVPAWYDRRVK